MDKQNRIPYGHCHCGCGEKTTIASANHTAKGYVKGEPRLYLSGHNHESRRRPLAERLWEKVDPSGECWLYTGYRNPQGYGQINVRGDRCYLVHRLVAEAFHGPPPPRREMIRHLCGTPACCRPSHLRWGTMLENAQDAIRHGTTQRGEKHAGAKLTAKDVREIRSLIDAGEVRSEIARSFGVHPGTIRSIALRQTWGWLDG